MAFKNFRPISNLQFVSKLVERAAADQLQSHLVKTNLFPTLQSAYRPNHSTETALLKIKNGFLMNIDKQHVTLLILLDLSAAFDTVDHQILLNRLCPEFGVSGKVLDWFSSYLSDRFQKITVDGVLSDRFNIDFGVPQGSCLGPLLFVIYSSKLFNIVNNHLPNVHAYADNTQLYLVFKPGNSTNETAAVSSIQSCIRDLQNWMLMDRLKVNPDRTEFLVLGTRQQLEKVITSHFVVGESRICPSTKVKNLGSWFDPNLDMISHINNICSSSFYYLYNLRRIRKYLPHQSAIYPLSTRLSLVNWTTATVFYMAFLQFI